jgi:molybdopterin-guanine dinucleotide biosynthesis adapter protein
VHCDFDIDHPGKDSYRHRKAGATEVLITSAKRWALIHELDDAEPDPSEQLRRLAPCDLVLVDDSRARQIPTIEIYQAATSRSLLFQSDRNIVAIATDTPIASSLPQLGIDDMRESRDLSALPRFFA